jgi:purine-binding chemotaxis protein CheW
MTAAARTARAPVDWGRIKARLAFAEQTLASGFAVSPERRKAILHARAQAHAAAPPPAEPAGARIDVVEFMLGPQRHAVEAVWVREVLTLKDLTPLPCTPGFVAGVVHSHGRILTVIDLKRFFDLPATGLTDLDKLVVLQHGDTELALLADRIAGVGRLRLADLHDAPADKRARCLRGVSAEQVFVLDAAKLLNDPLLVVDEELNP